VRDAIRHGLAPEVLEARAYTLPSPLVPVLAGLDRFAAESFVPDRPLVETVVDLMSRIHREFTYDPGFTTVATPLADVLEHRRGVCQDFAHLAIAALRSQGLAARYVSGYLETARLPAGNVCRVPTPATRGSRCSSPRWDGSISIPPTTKQSASATSPSDGDATIATWRP
jgi:transglutaminase-like putative cysteine protease